MTHLRADNELASSISLAGCDACSCGAITLRLHDNTGAIYAAAHLGPDIAPSFLDRVRVAVEQQQSGGLGAIRCEGVA